MQMPFLSSYDVNQIALDFEQSLKSRQGVDLKIAYREPVNPVADQTYGGYTADLWVPKIIEPWPRAIQKIITSKNVETLGWGILKLGDCIFYLSPKINLAKLPVEYQNVTVETQGVVWFPVGKRMDNLHKNAVLNLGNDQIAQVIPCRLDRSAG
jgi:hypothetical protein